MYLKSLALKNFRCFEQLNIEFNPEYTVLVGNNGAGKSSIIDAAAIALCSCLSGFDSLSFGGLNKNDARLKSYEMGSRIDSEPQYPVDVEAVCVIDGQNLSWGRRLSGSSGHTLHTGSKAVLDYSKKLQNAVRNGDKDTILPILGYYGTQRSFISGNKRRGKKEDIRFSRCSGYVDCMNSSSNDTMMMQWFEQMTGIGIQENKKIPELEVVKKAMGKCFSGAADRCSVAEFEYKLKSRTIEITYDGVNGKEKLPMSMLSDGVRNTICMVADIAYRMAVLNPQLLDRVLDETPGIVLIDEVDLHLHPEWQKRIMADLHYIFPKVQFIVTTHAPSILVNITQEHLLLLEDNQVYIPTNTTYGRDIAAILREMMKVEVRPEYVLKLKNNFYKALSEENFFSAKQLLDELENVLGANDADVVEAKVSYDLEQL